MARITHRLTAVKVAGLKTTGLHPDGHGLYLRITETGTKGWIWRYYVDGKARDMGLGPVSTVGLARARELAAECRLRRRDGLDPIAHRQHVRQKARLSEARGMTFKDCAKALIASHETSWRNAKHRQQWRNTLTSYVYPVFGNVPVDGVDTAHVLKVLEPIWTKKPETASRIRGRIEAVLDWAKARGARQGENPARWRGHLANLLPPNSKVRRVRHHPALPFAEIPAFMTELRSKQGIAARSLEFLILTACRTSEALGARLEEEFDLRAKLWTVPAERMKAGREHRVPLSTRAVAIVKEMAEMRQNEFVFPGLKEGRPLSDMSLAMLLRDLGYGHITVHGFRSSFRDWAAETTNFQNHVVEMALAHVVGDKVEAAYRRGDLFEKRRKLMDAWATCCGRYPVSSSVVPLKRRSV